MLGLASAASAQRTGDAFFEAKIRPVLAKNCYSCHSAEANKAKGGLKVDTRAGLLKGGDTGPAVVPRSVEKSLLHRALTYHDESMRMPPDGKLPDATVADFRKWIEMGAPDPRGDKPAAAPAKIDIAKGREQWAYRTPAKPAVPAVRAADWPLADVDRFVLAGLERNSLKPTRDADPRTIIRRLHLTLVGLPPAPDAMERWTARLAAAAGPVATGEAMGELADELLASPAFGEHWGRHWLDVARFGESTGGDANNVTPHAWRYRNYVIDAFNADTPYDRFILEQLAGDLLPAASPKEHAANIVATGFLATGPKLVGEEEGRRFFADLVDEQIDATTRVFLGATVACARCHDHKSDPIPQTDYYALAGIFRSSETHFGLLKSQARQANPLIDISGMGLPAAGKPASKEQLAKLRDERDRAAALVEDIYRKRRAGEQINQSVWLRARTDRDRTTHAYEQFDAKGNPRVFAMGMQDRELPVETWLNVRGEPDKFGPKTPRGFVQALAKPGKHALPPTKGSGRLELAKWIAHRDHPRTARVMANRVWHHLFGSGLVRSADDFGATGEPPSHPELLDFLALRFVEHQWSVKALLRELVLTRTWRQAADHDEARHAIDPENRWLWRTMPRRLTAEALRDAMLQAGGNLDPKRPPGTSLASVGEGTIGRAVFEPEIRKLDADCRSVYLPRVRNVLPEMLELFDAPDASLVMGVRETTTSPLQGLFLMNSPFVQRQAEGLARRAQSATGGNPIAAAHVLALGRPPTDRQRASARSFLADFRYAAASARLSDPDRRSLQAYCHALLCSAEFRILD
jgi:cytochrome c553